jgi:hypothetical protein
MAKEIERYTILFDNDPAGLSSAVNAKISQGWQPLGGDEVGAGEERPPRNAKISQGWQPLGAPFAASQPPGATSLVSSPGGNVFYQAMVKATVPVIGPVHR